LSGLASHVCSDSEHSADAILPKSGLHDFNRQLATFFSRQQLLAHPGQAHKFFLKSRGCRQFAAAKAITVEQLLGGSGSTWPD